MTAVNLFQCPGDFAKRTGLDPRKMRQIGLGDTVLYRTVILAEDPATGKRYDLLPCRNGCVPPLHGDLPQCQK